MRWKGFMAENDIWTKKEDLENAKELEDEFERRLSTEVFLYSLIFFVIYFIKYLLVFSNFLVSRYYSNY